MAKLVSSAFQERRSGWWMQFGRMLPFLILATSLSISFRLWESVRQVALNDLQADFAFQVRDVQGRIEQRMRVYEQMLRGVQSFAYSSNMERAGFHNYVQNLRLGKDYPGVQGVGYIQLVPGRQKAKHVAAIRIEGFPEYQLKPEGERDDYAPTVYMEPFTGDNRKAFGFDNLSDPMRQAAMELACDLDASVMSGKIAVDTQATNTQATNTQARFRMYLPVYRKGAPHGTPEQRRANIEGWVYSRFNMSDLMQGILRDSAGEIDIEIHDGDDVSNKSLLYDPDVSGSGGWAGSQFHDSRRIRIANRYWTIAVRSLYGFESRLDQQKQEFIAYASVGISVLLALLTGILVSGRERALRYAREINNELVERKRAEEGLRLSDTVIRIVEEAVLVTDADNNIISVNPAFSLISGYEAEEVIGRNPRILSSGKHDRAFFKELWDDLLVTGTWHGEIWDKRKNGELYVKWLSIRLLRDEAGRVTHHVGVFYDISERKAEEARIQHLAHHDQLTGLPNRMLLADRLQQALAQARRDKGLLALMFMDLDKFKPINDTLGHEIGDLLLKEVAQRLLRCVRESDTVSRIGGDEFVVLLTAIEAGGEAMPVAQKILHAITQPFELAGHSLSISASIGIALYPEHGVDESTLTKHADIAMYYAKAAGRNGARLFEPEGMCEISRPENEGR